MTIVIKDFDDETQKLYVNAMCLIMNLEAQNNSKKLEYIKQKAGEMGFDQRKIKTKSNVKATQIIDDLSQIDDIRLKRFLIREMILVAIADQELSDKDVDTIYYIGTKSGVAEDKIDDFFLWAARGVEWQVDGVKLIEEDL